MGREGGGQGGQGISDSQRESSGRAQGYMHQAPFRRLAAGASLCGPAAGTPTGAPGSVASRSARGRRWCRDEGSERRVTPSPASADSSAWCALPTTCTLSWRSVDALGAMHSS